MQNDNKFKVEKSNILNTFYCNSHEIMSVNELRFFCMYLSRLNPQDIHTRTIEIKIQDFENLFNIRLNTTDFSKKINKIMDRKIYIYNAVEDSNEIIHLYSKFKWYNNDAKDTISITANSDIMPYLFNLTSSYTSYQIGNIAKLNTVSKIRLYELLCQYKKMKEITFEVNKLQQLLMTNYTKFKYFNEKALSPAVKDINEYTDIMVTYEKILRCRKCVALKFFIENKSEKTSVAMHQEEQTERQSEIPESKELKDLYKKYFTSEHEEIFKDNIRLLLLDIYSSKSMIQTRTEEIFRICVATFRINSKSTVIKSPMSYMQGIINNLIDDERKNPKKEKKRRSYDINQFERFAINYNELQKISEE